MGIGSAPQVRCHPHPLFQRRVQKLFSLSTKVLLPVRVSDTRR